MITIYLNSKKISCSPSSNLYEVLYQEGYQSGYFAVAVNRQFVSRSSWSTVILNEGDQIDLVSPMQGG